MKQILILLALLATLQLLAGDVIGSWELQYTADLEQLQMLRQSAGQIYGVGWKCFVRSTNGTNFQNTIVDDRDSLFLESAYMVSSTVGYCGGYIYRPSDPFLSRPVLYKTINSGQSWIRTGQFEQQAAYYVVSNVQFITEQEGYVALNPLFDFDGLKIYRTTNGGQSWSLVYGPSYGNCLASDFSPGLMIVGKNSPQGVLISANGTDWQLKTDSIVGQNPTLVLSKNGRIIVRTYPNMLYSDDTGQNWSMVDFTALGDGFSPAGCLTSCAMSALGSNIYMVAGIWDGSSNHRGIIRSLNNGTSWQWAVQPADMPDQSGQIYGICYWGEYIYIAHNGKIYRLNVGPVANDDPTVPVVLETITCYPNPFRGSTNVIIKQTDNSPTTVSIYNLRGQLIRTLVNSQKLLPGEHSYTWDGKNDNGQPAAAGIYFFKMVSGKYSATRKMLLLR